MDLGMIGLGRMGANMSEPPGCFPRSVNCGPTWT